MKGFIRILESVIASLILLSSLSYFFTASPHSSWDTALLQTDVQDALAAMDRSVLQDNIIANNKAGMENGIRALLPDTVDFSTTIEGIPNPEIFVGCQCTGQEINDLKQILRLDASDMIRFKERNIAVKIKVESFESIDARTNILFLFGYEDLTPNRAFIDRFLARGGTIFMLARIENLDANLREIFGLEEALPSGSKTAEFYDTQSPANVSFRIFDYFVGVGGNASEGFGVFASEKIKVNDKSVAVDRNQRRVSYAKVNYNINAGRGRAVWIGDYNFRSSIEPEVNTNKLVTALVLWGSGEEYSMDTVQKSVPEGFHEFRYTGVLGGSEPFEIRLKVWQVFY
mgnify:CR=1 FL=1